MKKKISIESIPIDSSFVDISCLSISSLAFLDRFTHIVTLDASRTEISNLKGVHDISSIANIKIAATPIAMLKHYRLMLLIVFSSKLSSIDDITVSNSERKLADSMHDSLRSFLFDGWVITKLNPTTIKKDNVEKIIDKETGAIKTKVKKETTKSMLSNTKSSSKQKSINDKNAISDNKKSQTQNVVPIEEKPQRRLCPIFDFRNKPLFTQNHSNNQESQKEANSSSTVNNSDSSSASKNSPKINQSLSANQISPTLMKNNIINNNSDSSNQSITELNTGNGSSKSTLNQKDCLAKESINNKDNLKVAKKSNINQKQKSNIKFSFSTTNSLNLDSKKIKESKKNSKTTDDEEKNDYAWQSIFEISPEKVSVPSKKSIQSQIKYLKNENAKSKKEKKSLQNINKNDSSSNNTKIINNERSNKFDDNRKESFSNTYSITGNNEKPLKNNKLNKSKSRINEQNKIKNSSKYNQNSPHEEEEEIIIYEEEEEEDKIEVTDKKNLNISKPNVQKINNPRNQTKQTNNQGNEENPKSNLKLHERIKIAGEIMKNNQKNQEKQKNDQKQEKPQSQIEENIKIRLKPPEKNKNSLKSINNQPLKETSQSQKTKQTEEKPKINLRLKNNNKNEEKSANPPKEQDKAKLTVKPRPKSKSKLQEKLLNFLRCQNEEEEASYEEEEEEFEFSDDQPPAMNLFYHWRKQTTADNDKKPLNNQAIKSTQKFINLNSGKNEEDQIEIEKSIKSRIERIRQKIRDNSINSKSSQDQNNIASSKSANDIKFNKLHSKSDDNDDELKKLSVKRNLNRLHSKSDDDEERNLKRLRKGDFIGDEDDEDEDDDDAFYDKNFLNSANKNFIKYISKSDDDDDDGRLKNGFSVKQLISRSDDNDDRKMFSKSENSNRSKSEDDKSLPANSNRKTIKYRNRTDDSEKVLSIKVTSVFQQFQTRSEEENQNELQEKTTQNEKQEKTIQNKKQEKITQNKEQEKVDGIEKEVVENQNKIKIRSSKYKSAKYRSKSDDEDSNMSLKVSKALQHYHSKSDDNDEKKIIKKANVNSEKNEDEDNIKEDVNHSKSGNDEEDVNQRKSENNENDRTSRAKKPGKLITKINISSSNLSRIYRKSVHAQNKPIQINGQISIENSSNETISEANGENENDAKGKPNMNRLNKLQKNSNSEFNSKSENLSISNDDHLISDDTIVLNQIHLPSESAQIDEFLELEQYAQNAISDCENDIKSREQSEDENDDIYQSEVGFEKSENDNESHFNMNDEPEYNDEEIDDYNDAELDDENNYGVNETFNYVIEEEEEENENLNEEEEEEANEQEKESQAFNTETFENLEIQASNTETFENIEIQGFTTETIANETFITEELGNITFDTENLGNETFSTENFVNGTKDESESFNIRDHKNQEEEEENENDIFNEEEENEKLYADIFSPTQCMNEEDVVDSTENFEDVIQPLNFESSNFIDSEIDRLNNLEKIYTQQQQQQQQVEEEENQKAKPKSYQRVLSPSSVLRQNKLKRKIIKNDQNKNMNFNFSYQEDDNEIEENVQINKKPKLPPASDLLPADDDEGAEIYMPSDFLNDLQLSICLSDEEEEEEEIKVKTKKKKIKTKILNKDIENIANDDIDDLNNSNQNRRRLLPTKLPEKKISSNENEIPKPKVNLKKLKKRILKKQRLKKHKPKNRSQNHDKQNEEFNDMWEDKAEEE